MGASRESHHSLPRGEPEQLAFDLGPGAEPEPLPGMVGRSPGMLELYTRARSLAGTGLPLCVVGETGTGKELVAEAVHQLSGRPGPFIALDGARLEGSLVDSELFGHVRGAFTGADQACPGAFVAARGGTLFLDECSRIPLGSQAKLLRALERGQVVPVGSHQPVAVDVRVIAAFQEPPGELVTRQKLLLDLYFRLAGGVLAIAPLREHPGDVPLLIEAIDRANPHALPRNPEATEKLCRHGWPGNVRELKSTLQCAHALARGRGQRCLRAGDVEFLDLPTPEALGERSPERRRPELDPEILASIAELGSKKAAAARHGMHPNALRHYPLPRRRGRGR